MSFVPHFRIYEDDESTFRYLIPVVQYTNAPQSAQDYVEISNIRARGSLIVDGGTKAWDLVIRCILSGEDYEELVTKIDELEAAIPLQMPLYLKLDKTASTTYSYKVQRLEPIEYSESLRNNFQEVTIVMRVNSW